MFRILMQMVMWWLFYQMLQNAKRMLEGLHLYFSPSIWLVSKQENLPSLLRTDTIFNRPLKSAQDWILIFVIRLEQYDVGFHKIRSIQGTMLYIAPIAVDITATNGDSFSDYRKENNGASLVEIRWQLDTVQSLNKTNVIFSFKRIEVFFFRRILLC